VGEPCEIVAIEGDVEGPDRDRYGLVGLDQCRQPVRERDPAAADADEHEVVGAAVALDDLVRDAGHGSAQVVRVQDAPFAHPSLLGGLAGPR